MKKRNLLAMAALATAGSAFADEFWIIKDGQLNSDYTQMAYPEDEEAFDIIEFGQAAPDGSTTAIYKHNGVAYKDVKIDMTAAPVDLNKAWNLVIEYMLPASAVDQDGDVYPGLYGDKKPMFIFGLTNAEEGKEDLSKPNARIAIDGKAQVGGTWIKEYRYAYANPADNINRAIVISYARENGEVLDGVCIKNLGFIADDENGKPFYAENFDAVKGIVPEYSDNTNAAKLKPAQLAGNYSFTSDELITLKRFWQEGGLAAEGNTSNDKYKDDEMLHALVVTQDASVNIEGIAIPADNQGKVYIEALVNFVWEDGTDFYDAPRAMNAAVTFDNGATVPMFGADAVIPTEWSVLKNAIDVPAGAKTMSLVFANDPKYAYCVDNVILANKPASSNEEAAAKASVVVTPNPATDVITVAGAEKIVVKSMNGVVVASANGEKANVAALAAGAYIVNATVNGVELPATIVIKK